MTIIQQSLVEEKDFNLTEQDLDNLAKSYIDEATARRAKLFRVDSPTGAALVGQNGGMDCSGTVFPYYGLDSDRPREYRLRCDNPDTERKTDGKLKVVKK